MRGGIKNQHPWIRVPGLAFDDVLHHAELDDVDHDPGGVTQEEDEYDAQEDQAEVELLPLPADAPEPLDFVGGEVQDDPAVQVEEEDHGDHGRGE